MFYLAEMQFEAGCSVILDNSFDPSLSALRFQALKTKYGIETIQIVCNSDQDTLFNRLKKRAETGNRHPGHGDNDVLDEFRASLAKEKSLVMSIGGLIIEVDTTEFSKVDYSAIINEVKSATQKSQVVK